MSPSVRGHASERGFSLVELLIAITMLLVVLSIAHGLLVESLRIFAGSGRELRRPDQVLALRQLRADLLASAPAWAGAGWIYDPLDARSARGTVRWQKRGENLERRLFDAEGDDLGTRPMLDGMVSFRWRTLVPGLVEVEVVRRVPRADSALRASTPVWRQVGEELEQATVVAASRQVDPW